MSDAIVQDMNDPHRQRGTLLMLANAVQNQWPIPPAAIEAAPKVAARLLLEGNDRVKLGAIKLLLAMQKNNIEALVQLDKIERLEAGAATENHGITVRYADEASIRLGGMHDA